MCMNMRVCVCECSYVACARVCVYICARVCMAYAHFGTQTQGVEKPVPRNVKSSSKLNGDDVEENDDEVI